MRLFGFIFSVIFIFNIGCNPSAFSNSANLKSTYFSIKTNSSDFTKNKIFLFKLPSGGKKEKLYPNSDRVYVEYRVHYKDSSIFYISNDIWNGSRLNIKNLSKIGIVGYNKKTMSDTTYYSGTQEGQKNWADYFLGEIVVGYTNVPNNKKDDFEKVIHSIIVKE